MEIREESANHCEKTADHAVNVYENWYDVDETTRQIKRIHKLAGKLDKDGNFVPTRGLRGRPRKKPVIGEDDPFHTERVDYERKIKQLRDRVDELAAANREHSKKCRVSEKRCRELLLRLRMVGANLDE